MTDAQIFVKYVSNMLAMFENTINHLTPITSAQPAGGFSRHDRREIERRMPGMELSWHGTTHVDVVRKGGKKHPTSDPVMGDLMKEMQRPDSEVGPDRRFFRWMDRAGKSCDDKAVFAAKVAEIKANGDYAAMEQNTRNLIDTCHGTGEKYMD